jgi:hypothetical protein
MKTLSERIETRFAARSIEPTKELVSYASSCDSYAQGMISHAEMQNAMCNYLDASSLRVRALSEALNRLKEPAMSEVVTEAVNMFVDSVIRTDARLFSTFYTSSEKNVRLSVGSRKPDISIWKGDKLISIIECKTCLGRRRKEWMDDYSSRVEEFSTIGLDPESMFLFVATDNTWGGFPKNDSRFEKVWFSLCPVGTWYGGGKAGEVKLICKQHEGALEKISKKLIEVLSKA